MSELIPHSDQPLSPVSISKTELKPIKATDNPGLWLRFVDFVRQNIGLKPLYLTERFAEAKVSKEEIDNESREIDNQIKLLKAKQEYELVQAEMQLRKLEAEAKLEQTKAQTRSQKALARIQEAAAREVERRDQTPEEKLQRLLQIVDKIRALGGDVEIPPLEDEWKALDEDENDRPPPKG